MKHPIEVITMEIETNKITDARTINHNNDSDRRWLGSHIFWALRNGHGVQLTPMKEDEN